MTHNIPEPDPRSRFEDEGIPDLQEGAPEQDWAVDPQEEPLPGDRPVAVDDYGTTAAEQAGSEPLDGRLDRDVPEEQPVFGAPEPAPTAPAVHPGPDEDVAGPDDNPPPPDGSTVGAAEDSVTADSGLGAGSDLNTDFEPGDPVDPAWPAQPEEPSGRLWEEPRPAGRLVAPDEGAHPDTEPDEVAREVGPDRGGFTAEEAAMNVEPE
jgi:Family of unknown function (DUF5709)